MPRPHTAGYTTQYRIIRDNHAGKNLSLVRPSCSGPLHLFLDGTLSPWLYTVMGVTCLLIITNLETGKVLFSVSGPSRHAKNLFKLTISDEANALLKEDILQLKSYRFFVTLKTSDREDKDEAKQQVQDWKKHLIKEYSNIDLCYNQKPGSKSQ